ncbi:MAG: carbohydrate kinase family protein, partial [Clostridia bacterium]|nr:carbohydrate kinase family protein [Clostridia bacterium]
MKKKGIAVVGSILVDEINAVSKYPSEGELTRITAVKKAVGGCVPNVAVDLKKISPQLNVFAVGKVGNDENGQYVSNVLDANGVNTDMITVSDEKTSFTQVISVSGGQRTFFTYPGASADFGNDDIDYENLEADIFHLGYFLLLQKIDEGDGLKILKKIKEKGIKTSIDLVSENSDRYKCVLPCLPFTDYLIINELEAGRLTGISPDI